jgi:hypothetical protein
VPSSAPTRPGLPGPTPREPVTLESAAQGRLPAWQGPARRRLIRATRPERDLDDDGEDRNGVTCHFCHSLVDPVYVPGQSPPDDEAILAGLDAVPEHRGNASFVLDPQGRRRGPYEETDAPRLTIASPVVEGSAMCGTCDDVGNVATWRRADGSWNDNAVDPPVGDEDLWSRLPLERTCTEWKLSAFAAGGVDLGSRFGGARGPAVATCRDCHMPTPTRVAATTAASATTSPATSSPAPPRSRST